MKSILFIAFLALAAMGCDTPESTIGNEGSMNNDSAMTAPRDTVITTPVDSTGGMPLDTSSSR